MGTSASGSNINGDGGRMIRSATVTATATATATASGNITTNPASISQQTTTTNTVSTNTNISRVVSPSFIRSHPSSSSTLTSSTRPPSPTSSTSSTTASSTPIPISSTANAATRPRMSRPSSQLHRTGPDALVIPIPPTLANSPHLQSPNSIFRRHYAEPRASPGVEEERWLRDTVPMSITVDDAAVDLASRGVSSADDKERRARARANSASIVAVAKRNSVSMSPTRVVPPHTPALTLPRSGSGVYTQMHAHPLSPRSRG